MAAIALAAVGTAAGVGISGFAAGTAGAIAAGAIGGAVGGFIGNRIDQEIFDPGPRRLQGPRLDSQPVFGFDEGAVIPYVFGHARVNGQIIWATRYREVATTTSVGGGGGKGGGGGGGGATRTDYSYFASFAVAFSHGPVRFSRIWLNNRLMVGSDLGSGSIRFYFGDDSQNADPLISSTENEFGGPFVSGYRGVSYIVFDNVNLERFGNRYPFVSAEIVSTDSRETNFLNNIDGLVVGPGMGKSLYSSRQPVAEIDEFPGIGGQERDNKVININIDDNQIDADVSINHMRSLFRNLRTVIVEYNLFMPSKIIRSVADIPRWAINKTGPEYNELSNTQEFHEYNDASRSIKTFNRTENTDEINNSTSFQETPSDSHMISFIRALNDHGYNIILYPKVLINEDGLPWIGNAEFHEENSDSDNQEIIDHFFDIMKQSVNFLRSDISNIDGYIIGSEFVKLTKYTRTENEYPFVDALIDYASHVRAILDHNGHTSAKIGYSAHHTEYGAHIVDSQIYWPLDKLYAHQDIDFIGISNYQPLSDYAAGDDRRKGDATSIDSMKASVESGENYDYIYTSNENRAARVIETINSVGDVPAWVFRSKDFRNWWINSHRIQFVDTNAPIQNSEWIPQSKPIWFVETGCPSIDLGSNNPSHYQYINSDDWEIPFGSSGKTDFDIQRRYLFSQIDYWKSINGDRYPGMIENIFISKYDIRPYPFYPSITQISPDGDQWEQTKVINNKIFATSITTMIQNICGLSGQNCDVRDLLDVEFPNIDGYIISQILSPLDMLGPLLVSLSIDVVSTSNALKFISRNNTVTDITINDADILKVRTNREPPGSDDGISYTYSSEFNSTEAFKLGFFDATRDYNIKFIQSEISDRAKFNVQTYTFPLILDPVSAQLITDTILHRIFHEDVSAEFSVNQKYLALEPGDYINLSSGNETAIYRITSINHQGTTRISALRSDPIIYDIPDSGSRISISSISTGVQAFKRPTFSPLNLPILLDRNTDKGKLYFAAERFPFDYPLSVYTDGAISLQRSDNLITANLSYGTIMSSLSFYGNRYFHDNNTVIRVKVRNFGNQLISRSLDDIITLGENAMIVTWPNASGNIDEIIQYTDVTVISSDDDFITYDLTGIIRNVRGSGLMSQFTRVSSLANPVSDLNVVFGSFDQLQFINTTQELINFGLLFRVGPFSSAVTDHSYGSSISSYEGIDFAGAVPRFTVDFDTSRSTHTEITLNIQRASNSFYPSFDAESTLMNNETCMFRYIFYIQSYDGNSISFNAAFNASGDGNPISDYALPSDATVIPPLTVSAPNITGILESDDVRIICEIHNSDTTFRFHYNTDNLISDLQSAR